MAAPPPVPEGAGSAALPPLAFPPPTPGQARASSPPASVDVSASPELSQDDLIDADLVALTDAVDKTMCVNTVRVAIKDGFGDGVPVVVKRLDSGDLVPPGTVEAMIVLTGEKTVGKMSSMHPAIDYRAVEMWIRRCSVMLHLQGRRALRKLGYPI